MDQYMANQKEREKNNAFMHYTHISVDLVEKDHALTSMEIFPEGLNPFGMVHGGLLDTMMDNAAGSAVHTDGRSYVTQTCTLHFLRNRGTGKIIGDLSAISYILYMFVKFPLPMLFPSFLDLQISDLPALIGGFAMGPWYGCIIIVVKCLLKMPFTGTACVGELGDIVMGIAFVLPASFIYKYHKTRKGALLSLAVGVLSSTAAAMLVNRFVLIPFYLQAMFDGQWEPLLNMVSTLYPDATSANFYNYYIFLGVLPFNLLRCLICATVTFFTYKSTSKLLHY